MKLFVLASLLFTVQARPQEVMSEDEVELIPGGRSPSETEIDRPVVFVLRGLPRFPGVGSFFDGVPNIPGINFGAGSKGGSGKEDDGLDGSIFHQQGTVGDFGLDDLLRGVFGGAPAQSGESGEESGAASNGDNVPSRRCGLVCLMLGGFRGLQDEIDTIQSEIHPQDSDRPSFFGGPIPSFFDGDFDVNNSTYEEKELEDGTKVRINRTTLADKDEDGNKFFFHSSILHNFGDGPFGLGGLLPTEQDAETTANNNPTEDDATTNDEEQNETPTVQDLVPDSDPAFNEIDDEQRPSEEFVSGGVDKGLIE